jgi:DNA-binding transcriptional ArsR family regulator
LPANTIKTKTIQHADEDVFTAIAHPLRRRILETLVRGDRNVNQLAEPFGVTRSAVSQHLGILLDAGLVARQRRGREQRYHLRIANFYELQRWLGYFERFWPEKLDRLSAYLDSTESGGKDNA